MIKGYQVNPYPIRMPMDLRGYLEEQAKKQQRSLHAEIIFRLLNSKEDDKGGAQ